MGSVYSLQPVGKPRRFSSVDKFPEVWDLGIVDRASNPRIVRKVRREGLNQSELRSVGKLWISGGGRIRVL